MRSAAVWVAPSRYELPLWLQVGVACYSGCLTVVRVAQRMALDTLRGVLRAPANCVHVLTLAALLDGTGNACSYPEFVAHSNIVHRVYQHHPLTRLACWCWYVCVPSWASMQGSVAQLTCGTVIWAAQVHAGSRGAAIGGNTEFCALATQRRPHGRLAPRGRHHHRHRGGVQ